MNIPDEPRAIDPRFPAPDPGRVALLMSLDWDRPPHGPSFLAKATIGGRPITAEEREYLGSSTVNDLAAMCHLSYEAARIARERVELGDRVDVLLSKYGFADDETIGDVRQRMSTQDGAEFDRIADILWPDGYIWLGGPQ